jgi:[NiFe] hydrogenase diaphorase moiety small subunit
VPSKVAAPKSSKTQDVPASTRQVAVASTEQQKRISTLCMVAGKLIRKHDYAEARRVLSSVPPDARTDELNDLRRTLVQMLFAEGNHFCPSCERSGMCVLQALGYDLGVMTAGFRHFFPDRPVDASHPAIWLDLNRCVLCELCVRASRDVDGKHVFALGGRGLDKHLIVNHESGRLADTDVAPTDKAVEVCPVGVILRKRAGFQVPIGRRRYDLSPVSAQASADAPRPLARRHD